MSKFAEAENRMFKNKFVCKNCKSTLKSSMMKILSGKVKCSRCKSTALRPVRKK